VIFTVNELTLMPFLEHYITPRSALFWGTDVSGQKRCPETSVKYYHPQEKAVLVIIAAEVEVTTT
jgi:hypothetical protein